MYKFYNESNNTEDTQGNFYNKNAKNSSNYCGNSNNSISILKGDNYFEKQFSPPRSDNTDIDNDEISNIEKRLGKIMDKDENDLERVVHVSVLDFKIPKKIIKDEQSIINSEINEKEKNDKIKAEQEKKEKEVKGNKKKETEKEINSYYYTLGKNEKQKNEKIIKEKNKRRTKIRNTIIIIVSLILFCSIILFLYLLRFFSKYF